MSELVTVVVPARNEEANLGPCLSSILEQDWPNLQVLVVDGASTDGTGAIVESFARRDPRVELLVNPDRTIPRSLGARPDATPLGHHREAGILALPSACPHNSSVEAWRPCEFRVWRSLTLGHGRQTCQLLTP